MRMCPYWALKMRTKSSRTKVDLKTIAYINQSIVNIDLLNVERKYRPQRSTIRSLHVLDFVRGLVLQDN